MGWLSSTRGASPEVVCSPLGDFWPPEIWFENNRKISITKEICITIDFAPPPKKFLEESQVGHLKYDERMFQVCFRVAE